MGRLKIGDRGFFARFGEDGLPHVYEVEVVEIDSRKTVLKSDDWKHTFKGSPRPTIFSTPFGACASYLWSQISWLERDMRRSTLLTEELNVRKMGKRLADVCAVWSLAEQVHSQSINEARKTIAKFMQDHIDEGDTHD